MKAKTNQTSGPLLQNITPVIRASAVGVLLFGVMTFQTYAQQFSGTIQFSGGAQLDNADLGQATKFVSIFGPTGPGSHPLTLAATETGVYTAIPNGTPATFTPFSFNPPDAGVSPLWTLTIGPTTYSFDASSVTVDYQDSSFLDIGGTGVAHVTGMTDTTGTWSITDTGGDGALPVFTFGAATTVGVVTPEPSTISLMLVALVPLAYAFGYRPGFLKRGR